MNSNIFYSAVGENIRKYRNLRNYSLQDLAEKVGLTKKTIQRYENGEIRIDIDRIEEIAAGLGVDVYQLIQGAESFLGVSRVPRGNVPLVGTICAGDGLLAEQNIEDYINYPLNNKKQPDYALRVKGNSMIEAGIEDGDIVYMKNAQWADYNGQIVAAIITDNQDGTLKRIKWSEGSPEIELMPENPEFSTIKVLPNQVLICGVYMGHFKPGRDLT